MNVNAKESDVETSPQPDRNDPYAYLKRETFTFEKFKIKITGLPLKYSIPALRKLLSIKLKLDCSKIKPLTKGRKSWAFVCFRSEDDRMKALQILQNYSWKGKKLDSEISNAKPDPLVKKRNKLGDENERKECSIEESILMSTVPLWNMPYDKQLEQKSREIENCLKAIVDEILDTNENLETHLNKIEFSGIKPSPVLEQYRNKCEFSIGVDSKTSKKLVGFRVGSYADGSKTVGAIEHLPHVSRRMKQVVARFESFLNSSDLDVFDVELQTGCFRQLTIRWARTTDQIMLIVGVNSESFAEKEQLQKLKSDLKEFFSAENGDTAINSLYIHYSKKRKNNSENDENNKNGYELISGSEHIFEILNGIKFRISPNAFFQINTLGAEVLYNAIADIFKDNFKDQTVIDVCCGIGTIGLSIAKNCKYVYGIDSVKEAILDANENARSNDFANCEFFSGFAEEILYEVLEKCTTKSIACIIDPPRAGLRPNAIRHLRKTEQVQKLVYISCNLKGAKTNFVDFSRKVSKTMSGDPFVPKKCFAVDMFPHTSHCETVTLFERLSFT